MSGLRVAVAGGGLGGLCLAQGLLKAGVDVTVYERDAQLAGRRQGYRLHVDARAGLALEQCLPPGSLALFQATCSEASTRLTVVSERLRVLNEQRRTTDADPYAPATLSTSVNRQTLREVLAAGLDGRLVFGCELTGYELTGSQLDQLASWPAHGWPGRGTAGAASGCISPTDARPRRTCWSERTASARRYGVSTCRTPRRPIPASAASTARSRSGPARRTGCRRRCGTASPR